jgi:hypothetical protein
VGDGGESWVKESAGEGGGAKSGKVDRFLGRLVRLVFRTIWGSIKLVFKGLWRLVRPSKKAKERKERDRAA